jgi:hypothetical protein
LGHGADGRAEKETKSSQLPLWGACRHGPSVRGGILTEESCFY